MGWYAYHAAMAVAVVAFEATPAQGQAIVLRLLESTPVVSFSSDTVEVPAGSLVEEVLQMGDRRLVKVHAGLIGTIPVTTPVESVVEDGGGTGTSPGPSVPLPEVPPIMIPSGDDPTPISWQYRGPPSWELTLLREVLREDEGAIARLTRMLENLQWAPESVERLRSELLRDPNRPGGGER